MNRQFSRWLLIVAMGLSIPAMSAGGAYAWPFPLEGGYARWYGWAGPLYGGFGGYPGARYVNGADGGVWGGDCWSGTGVGVDVVPSPAAAPKAAVPGNSVIMNLTVPPDARVFVNGVATTSMGSERRYRSDNLTPGSYPYQVRVKIERNGQKLVESKVVRLQTGASNSVAFDLSTAKAADSLPTALTLHVPEGAKVFLGDNATRSTGAVRHFATQLKAGQSYSDYKVRVEMNVGGKVQTRQEVISLAAGETRELKFDFAAGREPQMAANGSR